MNESNTEKNLILMNNVNYNKTPNKINIENNVGTPQYFEIDIEQITETYDIDNVNNYNNIDSIIYSAYENDEKEINLLEGINYTEQTSNPLKGTNYDMLNTFCNGDININSSNDINNPTIIKVALDSDPTCTRAQAIAMLYKLAGTPNVDKNLPFKDIEENGWYSDALKWAYDTGITCGTSSTTFSPDRVITRGELDILLGRFNDKLPNCQIELVSKFSDVSDMGLYKDEITFAVNSGLLDLNSSTKFDSKKKMSRADTIQCLYQYAGSPQNDSSNLLESINNANGKGNNFTDLNTYEDINIFDSVLWGVNNGIVSKNDTFNPDGDCMRSQVVAMLYRMAGSPEVSGTIPFKDVDDDSWYNDALTWAYKSGIIKGTSATTFEPNRALSKVELAIILKRFNDYNNGTIEVAEDNIKIGESIPLEVNAGSYSGTFTSSDGKKMNYYSYVPNNATEDMPLVVYLHGDGSVGNYSGLQYGEMAAQVYNTYGSDFPFIFIQPNTEVKSWSQNGRLDTLKELIQNVAEEYHCDPNKIILSGGSRGGNGAWEMANKYSDMFSAFVPISGYAPINGSNFTNLPTMAVSTPASNDAWNNSAMQSNVNLINNAGGNATFVNLSGYNHNTVLSGIFNKDTFEWMISQERI